MLFVVLDDFLNDEIQKFLGKFRVKISPVCKVGEPRDLCFFAGRIGRGQGVFCFENTHGLCVLKSFAQSVDEDRVEAVNAFAMALEDLCGFGGRVGHRAPKRGV